MRRPLYIVLLLALALLFACDDPRSHTLSVVPQRASFGAEGGSGQIAVASTDRWSAAANVEWVVIDAINSTTVFYHLTANLNKSSRYALITISTSDHSEQMLIEQAAPDDDPLRALDSLALVALFDECDGANWYLSHDTIPHPWVLARPIYQWEGVTTEVIDGQLRVIALNLSGVGVRGELPASFGNLTRLQLLMLRQNDISGGAISLCAALPELLFLDLARNHFIDFSVPVPAGSFGKLEFLDLSVCNIGGAIPDWALLPTITKLSMAGCAISGAIPEKIASMTDLTLLDLSDNQLAGEIPQWITSLKKLDHLDLSTCRLTGTIPKQIGDLNALHVLKLAQNQLTGEIPISISQMGNLLILNLSDNKLTNLPDQIIERCTKLQHIDLAFNNIEGNLIPAWASLKFLETFAVVGNRLSGAIPEVLLADERWDEAWSASSLIIPQQEGYGFSN